MSHLLPHCVTPVTASTLIRNRFCRVAAGAASVMAVPAVTTGYAGSAADVKEPWAMMGE